MHLCFELTEFIDLSVIEHIMHLAGDLGVATVLVVSDFEVPSLKNLHSIVDSSSAECKYFDFDFGISLICLVQYIMDHW